MSRIRQARTVGVLTLRRYSRRVLHIIVLAAIACALSSLVGLLIRLPLTYKEQESKGLAWTCSVPSVWPQPKWSSKYENGYWTWHQRTAGTVAVGGAGVSPRFVEVETQSGWPWKCWRYSVAFERLKGNGTQLAFNDGISIASTIESDQFMPGSRNLNVPLVPIWSGLLKVFGCLFGLLSVIWLVGLAALVTIRLRRACCVSCGYSAGHEACIRCPECGATLTGAAK